MMNSPITKPISKPIPLTETDVKLFVDTWYAKLDVHPLAAEMLPMLADKELTMLLPETTLHGQADFLKWYDGVIHKFFDEVHTIKKLDILVSEKQADVHLVVNWQAHIWKAPAAKSQWIGFDATQRWVMQRSEITQQPVIVTYVVEQFIAMPESATL